jgi:hypothetical protein
VRVVVVDRECLAQVPHRFDVAVQLVGQHALVGQGGRPKLRIVEVACQHVPEMVHPLGTAFGPHGQRAHVEPEQRRAERIGSGVAERLFVGGTPVCEVALGLEVGPQYARELPTRGGGRHGQQGRVFGCQPGQRGAQVRQRRHVVRWMDQGRGEPACLMADQVGGGRRRGQVVVVQAFPCCIAFGGRELSCVLPQQVVEGVAADGPLQQEMRVDQVFQQDFRAVRRGAGQGRRRVRVEVRARVQPQQPEHPLLRRLQLGVGERERGSDALLIQRQLGEPAGLGAEPLRQRGNCP